jgi:hypothetical protein
VQSRKPQLMICVSVNPWLHSDTPTWLPFSWIRRMLECKSVGHLELQYRNRAAVTLTADCTAQRACLKAYIYWNRKGLNSFLILLYSNCIIFCSILFYSMLFYSIIFRTLLFYCILLYCMLCYAILFCNILF